MTTMDTLEKKYLSMAPVSQLEEMVTQHFERMSIENQMLILHMTVQNKISQLYPPTAAYRKSFLKRLLDKLEGSGTEICDELYEEYAALMVQQDADMECYKTYVLSDCSVTLRENQQLISGGTTGLCTWQASKHLAEWAIDNKCLFENRHILELGSGLGLTGLIISKTCYPNKYVFSDCHEQVLQKLAANIVLNVAKCEHEVEKGQESDMSTCNNFHTKVESDSAFQLGKRHSTSEIHLCRQCQACEERSKMLFRLTYSEICDKYWRLRTKNCAGDYNLPVMQLESNSTILLSQLDWEKFNKEDMLAAFNDVDTVIAADVVYDPGIIPALVNILQILLNRKLSNGNQPIAYIASTVRNTATKELFLDALDVIGINHTELPSPGQEFLFYDKTVPIQILKLQCKTET